MNHYQSLCESQFKELEEAKKEIERLNNYVVSGFEEGIEHYKEELALAHQVIEKMKSELHQQCFNNEHNLSIDQKVADEIKKLEEENEELREDLEWALMLLRWDHDREIQEKHNQIRTKYNL